MKYNENTNSSVFLDGLHFVLIRLMSKDKHELNEKRTLMKRHREGFFMGFKSKARKHQSSGDDDANDSTSTSTKKEGEQPCCVKDCTGFADKSFGGRSLSIDNAIETWGESGFEERKGRVRVCKSCYRKWKKDNKQDEMY
jgi:hypothetical protein